MKDSNTKTPRSQSGTGKTAAAPKTSRTTAVRTGTTTARAAGTAPRGNNPTGRNQYSKK